MHDDVVELHCRDIAVKDEEVVDRYGHDQGAVLTTAYGVNPLDCAGA
jgi:hypothetical protein